MQPVEGKHLGDIFKRMSGLVLRYRLHLALYMASGLLLGTVGAAFLPLMKWVLEFLVERQIPEEVAPWFTGWSTEGFFWLLMGVGVFLLFFKALMQFLDRYMEGWLIARVILDTQERVARKMLTMDFRFFQESRHGEIISKLTNDMGALGRGVRILCTLLTRPLELLCIVGYIVYTDWRLALLGFVALPAGVMACRKLAKRLRKASRRAQEKLADLANVMVQFLGGMRIVKAFGCEGFEADVFKKQNRELYDATIRRERMRAIERPLAEFMTVTGGVAVLALGGYWVLDGSLEAMSLQVFFLALVTMYAPAKELSKTYNDLQEASPGAERVFSLLDRESAMAEGTRAEPPDNWRVAFEGVDFSYVPGTPVLIGLDFAIPPGETLALVGRTGSGKSTVADLLLRLYDPTAGRITVGGVDAREFRFDALRGGMALVSQDAFLFNGSVRDNIAYGVDQPDMDRVERVARAAQIHDDIMTLSQGYDTPVGERGTSLSGGQRQRVAIARALYRNAPILIMDEATSALDAESERKVQAALDELLDSHARTSLVIAHRLSTVRRADSIAVLEDGRIVAQGKHEDLVKNCPAYANWTALQG